MAAISMILGNIMALVQTSIKRILAYSSVAHSGYMTVALAATAGNSGTFPVSAALFYILGYILITLGAFACLVSLETEGKENLRLDDLSGLASRRPWTAFALAAFMFSFAGMPPTVGFMGKFFVFNAAISNHLIGIVIIGAIGSAISLFYYLRVIVKMYMSPALGVAPPYKKSYVLTAVAAIALLLNLALGTVITAPGLNRVEPAARDIAKH
jgi:NADH-quinone oxidoreductase subunit N